MTHRSFLRIAAIVSVVCIAVGVAYGLVEGDDSIPTDPDELFGYLQSGAYRELAAKESAPHPSIGPHSRLGLPVRVYLNDTLDASLAADRSEHPMGASAVKEMFDEDGTLQGWAVMVKTEASSANGRGWFWYEVTSTTDGASPVAAANGAPLCTGCHFTGTDYVLTMYPLQ